MAKWWSWWPIGHTINQSSLNVYVLYTKVATEIEKKRTARKRAKRFLLNGMCSGLHFKWRKSRRCTKYSLVRRSTKRFIHRSFYLVDCRRRRRCCFFHRFVKWKRMCELHTEGWICRKRYKSDTLFKHKWPFFFEKNVADVVFICDCFCFFDFKANSLLSLRIRIHNEWKITVERWATGKATRRTEETDKSNRHLYGF